MSKKTLFIGAIASIIAINSVFGDTTVTSKQYVDTTRQATIPATGTNSATPGTTVVTYTGTAGQIGERGIYDGSNGYNETTDANKLVTAGIVGNAFNNIYTQINDLGDQIEQATDLPETTVTYKTCYQEVNGDCILWNLTDKDVYGKCHNHDDCAWLDAQCTGDSAGMCNTNTGKCFCGTR